MGRGFPSPSKLDTQKGQLHAERPERNQNAGPWSKPVLLALEEPGQYVTISTTQAASWALIEDWPIEDGPALDRALLVCADVIKGKRTGEEARRGVY